MLVRYTSSVLKLVLLLLMASAFSQAQLTFTNKFCPTGDGSQWVTTGDFNRDGRLDIATVSASMNSVAVCINTGSGNFTLGPIITVPGASQVRAADMNKDGILDLVVSGGTSSAPALYVLLGSGSGTFSVAHTVRTLRPVTALQLGDLDRNGTVDAVTTECLISMG